jgi:uncharacterized protein (TIGR02271 family)
MNDNYAQAEDSAFEGRSLVAAFADRESARAARSQLHDEGFHKTWMGVTHRANEDASSSNASGSVVDDGDDSFGAKLGRFFSGESGDSSLYSALVHHGVASSEARRIDGSLEPNSVILTVDGANHPELAAEIIEEVGGHVLAGESFAADDSPRRDASAATAPPTGSGLLGYGNADRYARGSEIDAERSIQLRGERLKVDKQSVSAGEATIKKEVITTPQNVDVPLMHEELFVERRAVAGDAADTSGAPIGSGETIRIPLMREEVAVTKRPVITGEYIVGKRQVSTTEHISETTREERLNLAGVERSGSSADVDAPAEGGSVVDSSSTSR